MNKQLLRSSFMEHPIFSCFWEDSILDYFETDIELDFVSQESLGFYQKKIDLPLKNQGKSEKLTDMKAKLQLILTSLENKIFDVEKAIVDIDSSGTKCAVMATVDVVNDSNQTVFSAQFNLGSKEAEKINTNSEFINCFAFLY